MTRPILHLTTAALALGIAAPAALASVAPEDVNSASYEGGALPDGQSAITAKVQVMLDRAGVSPGVIDGYTGENVDNAIRDFEEMNGFEIDGVMDEKVWEALGEADTLTTTYTITEEDLAGLMPDLTHDYGDFAKRDRLGFRTIEELVAEAYHMDRDLLIDMNPDADWSAGSEVAVLDPGAALEGKVAKITADKSRAQLLAYDADDKLIASYPATIGSSDTPSPEGSYKVTAIAINPTYSYNPEKNFQQGDNAEAMTLPPGPNGPVGTVWIDLEKDTFGLHGTEDPHLVGKEQSHGCIRLTNWDATELAGMVDEGVEVTFSD
ncbi:L,D-transpeptidase family protein [Henriciella sp. AS95]|uniref:L,D-transpeptidase family protein n=1 Tax=Henriciella sp. AS95 TaxID=3135782 RepID=UPI00317C6DF0